MGHGTQSEDRGEKRLLHHSGPIRKILICQIKIKETNWLQKKIEEIGEEYDTIFHPKIMNDYYKPISIDMANEIKSFLSQKLHSLVEEAVKETIKEIDKVYKKEQGIHNWLDLREIIAKEMGIKKEQSLKEE